MDGENYPISFEVWISASDSKKIVIGYAWSKKQVLSQLDYFDELTGKKCSDQVQALKEHFKGSSLPDVVAFDQRDIEPFEDHFFEKEREWVEEDSIVRKVVRFSEFVKKKIH